MKEIHAVSQERHGNKRWHRSRDYSFASKDAIVALTIQELPAAMMSTVVAFVPQNQGFTPVALQGLLPGRNCLVSAQGKWLISYVPALYRTYPFLLGRNGDQEAVLCIDESSNLVSQGNEGELFFLQDGAPVDVLKEVFMTLLKYEQGQITTSALCGLMQKHELFQPWELQIEKNGEISPVKGLFRIDEAKLNMLLAEALVELRNAGALVVAYSQLFSMQLLPYLVKLSQGSGSTNPTEAKLPADFGFTISSDDAILNFDNL